jgi:hypothetical protein
LFDELDIIVASVEVLVGEVKAVHRGGSAQRRGTTPDLARVGVSEAVAVWMTRCGGFPPLLRLIDQIRGMCERELGHSKLYRSCPHPLSSFYMRSVIEVHNHELVDALDPSRCHLSRAG